MVIVQDVPSRFLGVGQGDDSIGEVLRSSNFVLYKGHGLIGQTRPTIDATIVNQHKQETIDKLSFLVSELNFLVRLQAT